MLYCFARADQMVTHRFTDDVAICRAISKKRAIEKFSKLYTDISEEEVFKVSLVRGKVRVLTDY
jgi:hypothetical protein